MIVEHRAIVLDETDRYPDGLVPEAAVEECLKVLRTLRWAAVENSNHEVDIVTARALTEIVAVAEKHNREIETRTRETTRADSKPQPTGDQRTDPGAEEWGVISPV